MQSRKNGINDLICKAEIETDVEDKGMDTKGEGWVVGIGRLRLTYIDNSYKIEN